MRAPGIAMDEVLVIGGGADSPLWLQMIADAVGITTCRSLSDEASCLGAGIIAAVGAGWHASLGEAAAAMTRVANRFEPRLERARDWERLSRRQAAVYTATLHLQDEEF